MTGELRVQRREPCAAGYEGGPCIFDGDPLPCVGCNGDGTRWVTVGTLRHGRNHKYPQEGAYIAGTFCGFIADESDVYGRPISFYRPLYVIEEASDA